MKKREEAGESNETDLLEQAILKMATLLQVGFGCAGAEIIAKSFSNDGELDPMVPGARVYAIFGFCDIRDFTVATEYLQQDVMLFVNKIAQITHTHVVDSGGAPNKNIGDAFLLVWKLNSTKEGKRRSSLQKTLFDAALFCVQQIITDINQIGSLAEIMKKVRQMMHVI
jgi:class 3 adenylate cyclase